MEIVSTTGSLSVNIGTSVGDMEESLENLQRCLVGLWWSSHVWFCWTDSAALYCAAGGLAAQATKSMRLSPVLNECNVVY